jgi:energy-converting hydrogenase Eha subunit A
MKKVMGWMPDHTNNKVGAVCGIIGALYQFFLNIKLPMDFPSKLIEAGITAIVAGFLGIGGKELFMVTKRAFLSYFKKRKNKSK